MSQLSPQDLQSLQQLINVIAPKIIERLKQCEATIHGHAMQISDLIHQVTILHSAKLDKDAKTEKAKRGGKKKDVEIPQLIQPTDVTAPMPDDDAVTEPTYAKVSPESVTAADAPASSGTLGKTDAGIVAATQSVAAVTGVPSSVPTPAVPSPSPTYPVVEGVTVTGQIVYGVQYIMQQNFTDPAVIGQALQVPAAVVSAVQAMSLAEQAQLIDMYRQELGQA